MAVAIMAVKTNLTFFLLLEEIYSAGNNFLKFKLPYSASESEILENPLSGTTFL